MSTHLTALEEELLLDLLSVQDQFQSSQIPAGTIRGKVMFKMANRRGKTRPAPVHGLTEADRTFKSTFTRTLNRLVKKGFVERRAVGLGDFHGLPYQWGYGRHGKRDKDVFLTARGREEATRIKASRGPVEPTPPPRPKPVARPVPQRAGVPASPPPARKVNPNVLYHYHPAPGVACHVTKNPTEKGKRMVLYRHTVTMGHFDVVYEVTRTVKAPS